MFGTFTLTVPATAGDSNEDAIVIGAQHALHGEVAVEDYSGVIACSDGGARAYELLGTHTLNQFAHQSLTGGLRSVADSVRSAETQGAERLLARGLKVHDDLTIAALPLRESQLPGTE